MYMRKLTSQVVMTYDDPVAETKYGKVRGLKIDSTYIFRGIKYADAKRFEQPTEVKPWEGVKEAFQYGYVCSELNTPVPHDQFTVPHFFYPQNENCQYINIWTQSLKKDAKRPVMVWLHGGGWFSGSSVELLSYDGENLSVFGDVVVVSLNHRLNVLGYLDMSQYGPQFANSANAGLADLVMAMKWIHENIENFGGDPENVTIFGQSGGGSKVVSLMQTPEADGTFNKAIVESGLPRPQGKEATEIEIRNRQEMAARILKTLGIAEDEAAKIQDVSWYDLAQATMNAIYVMKEEGKSVSWGPVRDGKFFLGYPRDWGWREETIGYPMLVGSIISESGSLGLGDGCKNTWDDETVDKYLKEKFGDYAPKLAEEFKEAYPERRLADLLFIDTGGRENNYDFATNRAAAGGPTWNWLFCLESPYNGGAMPWHNAEECYVFHNAEYIEAQYVPGVSERLQDQMSGAWVQFAKTGDPNFELIPQWDKATADSMPTLRFDAVTDQKVDYDKNLLASFPPPAPRVFGGSGKMYAMFGVKPDEE